MNVIRVIDIPKSDNPVEAIFNVWYESLTTKISLEDARAEFASYIAGSKLLPSN